MSLVLCLISPHTKWLPLCYCECCYTVRILWLGRWRWFFDMPLQWRWWWLIAGSRDSCCNFRWSGRLMGGWEHNRPLVTVQWTRVPILHMLLLALFTPLHYAIQGWKKWRSPNICLPPVLGLAVTQCDNHTSRTCVIKQWICQYQYQ